MSEVNWEEFDSAAEQNTRDVRQYDKLEGCKIQGIITGEVTLGQKGYRYVTLREGVILHPDGREERACGLLTLPKVAAWSEYVEGVNTKERKLKYDVGQKVGIAVGEEGKTDKGDKLRRLSIFPIDSETKTEDIPLPLSEEQESLAAASIVDALG